MQEASSHDEYGLKDLSQLPILEQLHRLMHAIQKGYPYKETNGWKNLTMEQKRKLLEYIRKKRMDKQHPSLSVASQDLEDKESTNNDDSTHDGLVADPMSDPYLMMLRKKYAESDATAKSSLVEIYESNDGLEPIIYSGRAVKRKADPRWRIAEMDQYHTSICHCGVRHSHAELQKCDEPARSVMMITGTMMSTFGDAAEPCLTSVELVHNLVGNFIREQLQPYVIDDRIKISSLQLLVDIFPDEAVYYGRWREFRAEAKQEDTELDAIEEEELADDLDFFAAPQDRTVFTEAFMERIRFADERTKRMEWSQYSLFSQDRKRSFLYKKGIFLLQWLRLQNCSKASMEFLNFIAYHNIGKLVERAIKERSNGKLNAQTEPLLAKDINAVAGKCLGCCESISTDTFDGDFREERQRKEESAACISNGNNTEPMEIDDTVVNHPDTPTNANVSRLVRLKRLR